MKTLRALASLLLLFAAVDARAQIGIGGVANNTIYTTSTSFVVTNEVGYVYDVRLDGVAVPVGATVPVTAVDYHELLVFRTNTSTVAVTSRLVKFIVRSAERAATEDGLPPWTPYPSIPSATGEFAGANLRLLAPAGFPQGMPIPVVAWVEDATGHAVRVNGTVAAAGQNSVRMLRGVGSGFLSGTNEAGVLNYQPSVGGLTTSKIIIVETGVVWTGVGGTLSGSIDWPPDSRIAITNHVVLASGATLTIGEGSIVRLSPGVDITNNASVVINGTRERPVVFTPLSATQPWGGFTMRTSEGRITGTGVIFMGSGAAPGWFGSSGNPGSHRTEQALFFCAGTNVVNLTDSAAIWLAGQLGHAVDGGSFSFDHFLMQRTTSGGEYSGSTLPLQFTVNDSAFIECPDDSANYEDRDNDALYLVHGNHNFTNTLFGFTKDDGIDSGGSGAGNLTYQDCWFESSFHEANSLSGSGKMVNHLGTVFLNCGQALETGYEGPNGNLVGCLATGNLVGGRFGDNYSSYPYTGFLRATNSLLIHNYRNVWGMNWADWDYRTAQMDVRSNLLGSADGYWPANTVWNPTTDAARLAGFITGPISSPVGVGFALRTNQLAATALTNGIPVRLSRFSTLPVSINYTAESPAGLLASGTLHFQPGETVKPLNLAIANPQSHELISVRLLSPVNGEITGMAQVFGLGTKAATQAVTLIPFGATWRYLDKGSDQGNAWVPSGFDDSGWSNGAARLGFNTGNGNSGFATVLGFGPTSDRYRTYYFRKTFEVDTVSAFTNLFLEVFRDDGIVAYLNGAEIYRNNITNGSPPSYSSLCTNATDNGSTIQSATLPLAHLVPGTNVLAVEVHQSSVTSSDLVFDLQLTAQRPPAPVRLKHATMATQLVLYWTDPGYALEEAPAVSGPWTLAGETNPQAVDSRVGQRFYRLTKL